MTIESSPWCSGFVICLCSAVLGPDGEVEEEAAVVPQEVVVARQVLLEAPRRPGMAEAPLSD